MRCPVSPSRRGPVFPGRSYRVPRRFQGGYLLLVSVTFLGSSTQPATPTKWELTVAEGQVLEKNFPIANRCSAPHTFRTSGIPQFLILQRTHEVIVPPGGVEQVSFKVPATLASREKPYTGRLVVQCVDCWREPGCSQDRQVFEVSIMVTALLSMQDQAKCVCEGSVKVTKCPRFVIANGSGTCDLARRIGKAVQKAVEEATGDKKKGQKAGTEAENAAKPNQEDSLGYDAKVKCNPAGAEKNCVVRVTASATWKEGNQQKQKEFQDPKQAGHGLKGFL